MSIRYALRHRWRTLRWWYRTTAGGWTEGPVYAECPHCAGPVYHRQRDDRSEIVTYRCRNCPWHQSGTTDFEFYREQEPDGGDAAAYEELSRRIDVDELTRTLTADGHNGVTERLQDEVNSEGFGDRAENDE